MTPWNILIDQCTKPLPRAPRNRDYPSEERSAKLEQHRAECEERVLEAIQDGITTTAELTAFLEMGSTTIRIHIKSLLKQGKITLTRGVNNSAFFYAK